MEILNNSQKFYLSPHEVSVSSMIIPFSILTPSVTSSVFRSFLWYGLG